MTDSPFKAARAAWEAGARLRDTRRRMKKFAYGQQWDDPVTLPDGTVVTAAEHARRQLCIPVTDNLIRQIVKSVVGRFRAAPRPSRYASGRLARIAEANLLDELDARTLEEFLISGCAIHRVCHATRPEGPGPWTDIVSPARFFVNPFRDPRGHDIEVAGMLHDWSLDETIARMAPGDRRLADTIRSLYAADADALPFTLRDIGTDAGGESFLHASDFTRCRVIEVWTRSIAGITSCHDPETGRCRFTDDAGAAAVADVNRAREARGALPVVTRRRLQASWTGRWYTPSGRLLCQTAPRPCHPFAVKFYPLVDGEVHPFIEDVIDRQIQINRTLTMADRIMAVSAKEVVLMPQESVLGAPHWRLEDYARAWATPGSMIPYRAQGGRMPTVVNTAGISSGLSDLLAVEMRMIEQVSGVTSALQGQKAATGDNAALYRAQADNAATTLTDIFATFDSFRSQRDRLLLAGAK